MKKIIAALLLVPPLAHAAAETIEASVAKALAGKTIEQVEAHALLPKSQAEYDAAKQRVLDFLAGDANELDRNELYKTINQMLRTIDSDGHTMLWPQEVAQRSERSAPSLDTIPSQVRVLDTPHGAALVVNPPAIKTSETKAMQAYVEALERSIAGTEGLQRSCALVIDLSGQTGGNAWPPMVVLEPLFTDQNSSRFVKRDNERFPVASLTAIKGVKARMEQLPPHALERFRGQKYAVVYGPRTASAGEMIAVALQGEPGRSRSFGAQTYGMTTGNMTVAMPDNAKLLLTTTRYAFGDQPVLRGKLSPDVPAPAQLAVQQAAEWAAAQSPACAPRQASVD